MYSPKLGSKATTLTPGIQPSSQTASHWAAAPPFDQMPAAKLCHWPLCRPYITTPPILNPQIFFLVSKYEVTGPPPLKKHIWYTPTSIGLPCHPETLSTYSPFRNPFPQFYTAVLLPSQPTQGVLSGGQSTCEPPQSSASPTATSSAFPTYNHVTLCFPS